VAALQAARLDGKIRVVAYDLTPEVAELIHAKKISAAADTKGVSQARVAMSAVVNTLERRTKVAPHTILIKLGLVDQQNYASYPFETSIAPNDYKVVLSYNPKD
jgi:protein TorT